jgi:hypothetical protein
MGEILGVFFPKSSGHPDLRQSDSDEKFFGRHSIISMNHSEAGEDSGLPDAKFSDQNPQFW